MSSRILALSVQPGSGAREAAGAKKIEDENQSKLNEEKGSYGRGQER